MTARCPPRVGVVRSAMASLLLSVALAEAGQQPDLAREQRLRSEIIDTILDGEPLDLQTADGRSFLAIYMQGVKPPVRGTAVILHGRGFHPDWVDVVQPLRVGLAEQGWNTLSIQLPVLHKEAKYDDYVRIFAAADARIEAALDKARESAPGNIALVAHSCGSHMAQHWINRRGPQAVARFDAFVGIGMGATDFGQPMREPFALDKIGVPILDLYAENDFSAVLRLAPERLAAMRRGGHAHNAQVVVADAEHYFVNRGDVLLQALVAWLDGL